MPYVKSKQDVDIDVIEPEIKKRLKKSRPFKDEDEQDENKAADEIDLEKVTSLEDLGGIEGIINSVK